ncbi:MAG: CRISPR-associated endonuclease Cas2 [Planctomycetaceae bacterium]|nr:CRISPR-associated endonuclease Cas2 [Planctomycetaceae bacterium]
MPRHELTFSGYQAMWVVAMFDLPVKTKRERREYTRFRNLLLDSGFTKLQYSVYARFCASEDIANTFRGQLKRQLPPKGYVRFLSITDRQFGKMQSFHGKTQVNAEKVPPQLLLF